MNMPEVPKEDTSGWSPGAGAFGTLGILGMAVVDVDRLAAEQRGMQQRLVEIRRCLQECLRELSTHPVVQMDNPEKWCGEAPPANNIVSTAECVALSVDEAPVATAMRCSSTGEPDQLVEPVFSSGRATPGNRLPETISQAVKNAVRSSAALKQPEQHSSVNRKDSTALNHLLNIMPRNRFTVAVHSCGEYIAEVKEPARSGALFRFVHDSRWEAVCIAVIAVNAIFTAYVSDYELLNLGKDPTPLMNGIEIGLFAFYSLELLLKLVVHGLYLFVNEECRWNLFDLILVLISSYDVFLALFFSTSGANLSFMRLFRLLKLSKVLRVFRLVRFFTELRQMFNALQSSTMMLFWCLNMLALILFAIALVMVQGTSYYLRMEGDGLAQSVFNEIMLHFGGVQVSMISLYKATTGGEDWGRYFDLVSRMGLMYSAVFLFYTAFFTFTLFNILTGMVVENVVKTGDRDEEARVLEYRRRRRNHCNDLVKLFAHLDTNSTGKITVEEFKSGMQSDTVQAFMDKLELDPKDSELFFLMLSNLSDDGAVDTDSFVRGCMQLRGPAAGIDLQCLIFEMRIVHQSIKDIQESFRLRNIESASATSHPTVGHRLDTPYSPALYCEVAL